jgi:hypothetical protein
MKGLKANPPDQPTRPESPIRDIDRRSLVPLFSPTEPHTFTFNDAMPDYMYLIRKYGKLGTVEPGSRPLTSKMLDDMSGKRSKSSYRVSSVKLSY